MYTPSRRLLAATAALSATLFMAGCADDDDPIASPSEPVASASASPSSAPPVDAMCDAKVAIDAAFLAGGPPEEEEGATPSPEQVGQGISAAFSAPYAELKRTAQPEVAADVDTLVNALDAAIKSGDDEFFFKPDFAAADAKVDEFLTDECGFSKVSATAADFEFTGLPTVTPEGITALTLTNEGKEFHEMVVMQIDPSLADEDVEDIFQMDEEELGDKVRPMGVVLASPGTTATNFFDLPSGRYAVLCFISEGSDQEHNFEGDGPPHFTKGMLEELKVLGDETASPSSSASPSATSSSSSTSGSSSTSDEDEDSSPSPSSTSTSSN